MHSTHQFFMTERTLYLLVLSSRSGDIEGRLEYWLRLIQSFGGDSPVIVVCNKADLHEMNLDWTGLGRKFPNIRYFARRVSCEKNWGIDDLKRIIGQEISRLEHVGNRIPETWFAVKRELESETDSYFSYDRYIDVCERYGVTETRDQQTLIRFLHDLGTVLHFGEHQVLRDTNILNPEWVTKGVYQIVTSDALSENDGTLHWSDLDGILEPKQDYPAHAHRFIIEMMKKFELCFEFEEPEAGRYLFPNSLQEDEWADAGAIESGEGLEFQLSYNVLPGSIMSRFIVKTAPLIKESTYWKNGVLLESTDAQNQALVRADIDASAIYIKVTGIERRQRDFLGEIRAAFAQIHRTMAGIECTEMVPIPGGGAEPYEYLLRLRAMGRETFVPRDGADREIEVRPLLDRVDARLPAIEDMRERMAPGIRRSRGGFGDQPTTIVEGDYIDQRQSINPSVTNVQTIWQSLADTTNLDLLADELDELKSALAPLLATQPEHIDEFKAVIEAEKSAREGDGPKTVGRLKRAGTWAVNAATSVGTSLAAEVIKQSIGLGQPPVL